MCSISPTESFDPIDWVDYPVPTDTDQREIPNYYKNYVTSWPELYIELAFIFDHSMFLKHGHNVSGLHELSRILLQLVNYFYEPLNIKIALVDLEVWTMNDLIRYDLQDISETSDRLLDYCADQLLFKAAKRYDAICLISSEKFDQSNGIATDGGICGYQTSAVIALEYSTNKIALALTIAHELGHLLNMPHDDDYISSDCECLNRPCIMHSRANDRARHWSACSLAKMSKALSNGAAECLMNKPDQLFSDNHRDYSSCGDGIVDRWEECDCVATTIRPNIVLPSTMSCQNKCCNQSICRFAHGSKCSVDQCCDNITCQFQLKSIQCRAAFDECDFAEFCDGKSSTCPPDVYKHDGLPCQSGTSQCYKGRCGPVDKCKIYYNISGDQTDDACYSLNQNGSLNGNCGYLMNESFIKCSPRDTKCGLLQCNGALMGANDVFCGLPWQVHSNLTFSNRGISRSDILCFQCPASLIPPSGSNWSEYAYVADGVSCGSVNEKRVCYKQKCLKIDQVLSQQGCQNSCGVYGMCTNFGRCKCSPGYSGAACEISNNKAMTIKIQMATTEYWTTFMKHLTMTTEMTTTKNDGTVWTIILTIVIFIIIFVIVATYCIIMRKNKNEHHAEYESGMDEKLNIMPRNAKFGQNKKVFKTETVPVRKLNKGKRKGVPEKHWHKRDLMPKTMLKKFETISTEHHKEVPLPMDKKSVDLSCSSSDVGSTTSE